jgi:phospholipase/carboxylesterase
MAPFDLTACLPYPCEGFYTSAVPDVRGWPLRTFLPTGYEPNYPYPLLVFLHGHASSEEQILGLAPKLSRRNYICIALRGPHPADDRPDGRRAFTWGADGPTDVLVEDYIFGAVRQTRRHFHVHSERIYLAGFREGATLAYRLGLTFPEKFAGVISLNGCLPRRGRPLLRFPEVRALRVLIGHGIANAVVPLSLAQADHRLFYSAGLDVMLHTYPSNHRIHTEMLRDINHWIMGHIEQESGGRDEDSEDDDDIGGW